ncbi:conserved phage C-terminal domain-containing protein [Chryseobacterium sp.]|uniref:conserved phage C-terminal domain-containing protein n=1 Tax=Chryseobacterium sp. TaxID=1871047 RepID=UPI002898488F|nr:conserved phage C-terminal domain-containing protein [Chryseobacterium sp.]
MEEETINPENEILDFLSAATGTKFRHIKSNLSKIQKLFKEGFTPEEITEVMQLKIVQWKNNPKMAGYLRPRTLFSEGNFENYINEVRQVKQNPNLYAKYFKKLNNIETSAADNTGDLEDMFG